MGRRARTVGKSARPFWQWVATATRIKADMIFTECTLDFEPTAFGPLHNYYECKTLVIGPTDFGDWIRRPRRYCVLTLRTKVHICKTIDEKMIKGLLGASRHPEGHADALFTALA